MQIFDTFKDEEFDQAEIQKIKQKTLLNNRPAHMKTIFKEVLVPHQAELTQSKSQTLKLPDAKGDAGFKDRLASKLFQGKSKAETIQLEFLSNVKSATTTAIADKRRELMRVRFLQKIQDVADGRAKNFWQPTKFYAMPFNAKLKERTEYRQLKHNIFKNLVQKNLQDDKN